MYNLLRSVLSLPQEKKKKNRKRYSKGIVKRQKFYSLQKCILIFINSNLRNHVSPIRFLETLCHYVDDAITVHKLLF